MAGCKRTNVQPPPTTIPTVTMTVKPVGGNAPLTVTITLKAAGGIPPYQFAYSPSGGAFIHYTSASTFTYTYPNAGKFTISGRAKDALGTVTQRKQQVVLVAPSVEPPPPPPPPPPPDPGPGPDPDPGPGPGPNPDPDPGPIPPPSPGNMPPTPFVTISYYGLTNAQPDSFWQSEMDLVKAQNYRALEVWLTWPRAGAPIVNGDGSINATLFARLKQQFTKAAQLNQWLFLRLHQDGHFASKSAHIQGILSVCAGLVSYGNWILDVCNEVPAQYGPTDCAELINRARNATPQGIAVTASVDKSAEGCADYYRDVWNAGGRPTYLCPHFPRDGGWSTDAGKRVNTLRDRFKAATGQVLPVYLGEENRVGSSGTQPTSSNEFIAAKNNAFGAGAVGYCFHGDFGYVTPPSLVDQMTSLEKDVFGKIAR